MLEHKSVEICCIQETRFRGKLVRMIIGKAAQYKLFWKQNEKVLGGVRIFLEWVYEFIDISRVSDRMIVIRVLVQGIVLVISVYAPQ